MCVPCAQRREIVRTKNKAASDYSIVVNEHVPYWPLVFCLYFCYYKAAENLRDTKTRECFNARPLAMYNDC